MNHSHLKERLGDLHSELLSVETVDKDTERLLKEIAEDVENLLNHQGELSAAHHITIKERLEEAARHFDVSHPSLAATARTVINTLNNMGI